MNESGTKGTDLLIDHTGIFLSRDRSAEAPYIRGRGQHPFSSCSPWMPSNQQEPLPSLTTLTYPPCASWNVFAHSPKAHLSMALASCTNPQCRSSSLYPSLQTIRLLPCGADGEKRRAVGGMNTGRASSSGTRILKPNHCRGAPSAALSRLQALDKARCLMGTLNRTHLQWTIK